MGRVTSPGNDPSQPAAARIYDYLLGGKDNYAVDRAAADKVLAVAPDHGLELMEPGLADVQEWRQDTTTAPTRLRIAGAVGRKP